MTKKRNIETDPIATLERPGTAPDGHAPRDSFHIVAIGGSAGGFQAFRKLLETVSTDMKMAYVLIPHLDPNHPSLISQLLSRSTKIQITEAESGMRVESGHAYVIRPNTIMTMAEDRLKLVPMDRIRGAKQECINRFLVSLAQTHRERAIGVILSGTAADGSLGIEAIKSGGGVTFAQDQSAEFGDMPRNAIATGAVDFVLPPEGIARELERISRHPSLAQGTLAPLAESRKGQIEGGLEKILFLLKDATGVDFANYKRSTIERRIARRMVVSKIGKLSDYARHLEHHPQELRILHDELLINVTSFFRDPEAFEALKALVFPCFLKDRTADDPIRVWVPGCATGEEVYSIAIALTEFLEENKSGIQIQIFGSDASERVIEKARTGVYGIGTKDQVSPQRLKRFFKSTQGEGYEISRNIRDHCVFSKQDVTCDPPFSRIDLLSCRNMLIYLGDSLQKRVIPAFHYALKSTGFLMLGSSESVERYTSLFATVDKRYKIYSTVSGSRGGFVPVPFGRGNLKLAPGSGKKNGPGTEAEFDVGRAADRLLLAQYVPASIIVNDRGLVIEVRGETAPYLRLAPGKLSSSVLRMVREDLVVDLDAAVREARRTGAGARRQGVRFKFEERLREVVIEVVPIVGPNDDRRHFLVLFKEPPQPTPPAEGKSPKQRGQSTPGGNERTRELMQLKNQLTASREYQQSVVERLEATNEELRSSSEETLSANEELQSTNEELETSKEELQSANEELTTLNDELQQRTSDLGQLYSDLSNVIAGVNIPIAIVDAKLCLRRFTPQAERLLNVVAGDVGRRITDFKHALKITDFDRVLLGVIDTLTPVEQEVQDAEGRWYSMRVRPYRTSENKIDGAVAVFFEIDALKRSIAGIEEARAFTEAILNTVRDPLLVLGDDLRVESANRAFYEIFQVRKEETERVAVYDLGNRQWDTPRLRGPLEEIVLRNTPFKNIRIEHDFKTIGHRIMLLHASRIIFHSGKMPNILLAMEDITDREHVQKVRAQLAAVVTSSGDAIYTKALDGTILTWNKGAQRMLGYSEAEIVSKNVSVLSFPDLLGEEDRMIDKACRGEQVENYVTQRRRKDGAAIQVSLSISPVLDEGGKAFGTSTIARDITDQVRAEEARRYLAEASAIVNASLDYDTTLGNLARQAVPHLSDWCSIHLLEEAGTVRQIALAHGDPSRVKAVQEIVDRHPPDPGFAHGHPNVLRTGRSELLPELPDSVLARLTQAPEVLALIRSLGLKSFMCVPLVSRGRTLGAMSFAQAESGRRFGSEDLTVAEELGRRTAIALDNAILYQTAQVAVSARDKFLSIASHELRTPLTTLQLQLQGALRTIRKGELAVEVREQLTAMVEKAERHGNRIGHLIKELLDVSRIAASKLSLHREECDIGVLTMEVVEQFKPILAEKGLTVDLRAQSGVRGRWDRFRIEQVITNLLSNAIKFGDGKPIVAAVDLSADRAKLVIEDQGIGIPPEVAKRLFRPFEQGVAPGRYGGLGLGLFISKQIVEAHGGSILVESAPGHGARFTVDLPCDVKEE